MSNKSRNQLNMVSCISILAVVALAAAASAVPSGRLCICPLVFAPVCASNGKVYSNACMVRCYNKENHANLKVVYDGRCGELEIDNENEIEADSAKFCPCTREYVPVCGSDYHTYSNKCLLKCAAKKNKSLKMLHDGDCDLPITNFKLNWPHVHEMPDDDVPDFDLMVEQPSPCVCTKEYDPVCGSNMQTYPNKCLLECDMKNDKTLKMVYAHRCRIFG